MEGNNGTVSTPSSERFELSDSERNKIEKHVIETFNNLGDPLSPFSKVPFSELNNLQSTDGKDYGPGFILGIKAGDVSVLNPLLRYKDEKERDAAKEVLDAAINKHNPINEVNRSIAYFFEYTYPGLTDVQKRDAAIREYETTDGTMVSISYPVKHAISGNIEKIPLLFIKKRSSERLGDFLAYAKKIFDEKKPKKP